MIDDQARLRSLRARMSARQRSEMSEIIQQEMVRRGMVPGSQKVRPRAARGELGAEELRELYSEIASRREAPASMKRRLPEASLVGKVALFALVVVIGGVKVIGESAPPSVQPDEGRASLKHEGQKLDVLPSENLAPVREEVKVEGKSEAILLTELDSRRVELEKRRELLDRRDEELRQQSRSLAERLAELRALTSQLAEVRKGEETKNHARYEQLANVYSAMAPNEAAALLSRLDPDTALQLLQRMPEKRIGQILGLMDHDRAVDLTRALSAAGGGEASEVRGAAPASG